MIPQTWGVAETGSPFSHPIFGLSVDGRKVALNSMPPTLGALVTKADLRWLVSSKVRTPRKIVTPSKMRALTTRPKLGGLVTSAILRWLNNAPIIGVVEVSAKLRRPLYLRRKELKNGANRDKVKSGKRFITPSAAHAVVNRKSILR